MPVYVVHVSYKLLRTVAHCLLFTVICYISPYSAFLFCEFNELNM